MVTRSLAVRGRIEARAEPRFERLYDATLDDLVRRGPLARERFASHWSDEGSLRRLADRKRAALPAELARELTDYHRRLGASPATLAALERLARGEAVCAIAGQQPAPLAGPLYSMHKTASAAGLAATFFSRTGVPCVPAYWMHGEDSDFDEIRGATFADAALTLHERELPADAHADGGLVGGVALAPLRAIEQDALGAWNGLPGRDEVRALLERGGSGARDLGEANAALMLALFAEQGLIVIDPRLPAFRAAARTVIERYLARADDLSAAVRTAGDRLESLGARRALSDASLDSFVFAIEDGARRKLGVAEARTTARPLSPSVALRPVVQDGVLPTVAMACGPGEAAYLAQLREVYDLLGVAPACPVPRLGATWLPPAAVELIEESGADPWDLVAGADAVLKRHAASSVPAAVKQALERAHQAALEGLAGFAERAKSVDASLPQMVESARAKVDYQFQRLDEGLAGKVRHQLERRHPEWLRLRYYLLPGDRLQERRLAGLELAAYRGAAIGSELTALAAAAADSLASGRLEHAVVDL